MQCLRCGREIPVGQVFCQDCLADMEKYPVKPGTPIQIPKRQEAAPAKKPAARRPSIPPEEQVKRLKRRLWLVSVVLVLVLALGLAGVVVWMDLDHKWANEGKPLPGQNYSSVTGTESTGPTEP